MQASLEDYVFGYQMQRCQVMHVSNVTKTMLEISGINFINMFTNLT